MSIDYVEVKVEEGILRGQVKTSNGISKVKYCSFQGVPFAKPPIGDLRFKAPEPLDPWDGVRDALQEGNQGCQIMAANGPLLGDEDCLYLNLFTLELPKTNTKLKPVLFHIHGGGFSNGSGGSEVYTPDYFIEHDVVFVSLNYRVGVLGFLSLQNDDISGNAGLKDQVQALIWTRKNIKQFSGDPENITILGLSAGGASVEYLLLTELTKGLFKRAIIQSGSSLNTWSYEPDPKGLALKLAQLLGYSGDTGDDAALGDFFRNCSAKDLTVEQIKVYNKKDKLIRSMFTFAPCVEKEGQGTKFITKTPREILKSGNYMKVPLITGFVNDEGCLYYVLSQTVDSDLALLNDNPDLYIPKNLDVPANKRAEVIGQIQQFYFGGEPVSRSNIRSLIDIIGQQSFFTGINEATKYYLQSSQNPVYCYGTSYCPSNSFIKKIIKLYHPDAEIKVPHGGDINLMFITSVIGPPDAPTATDLKYIKIFTSLLTSFVKTGNPNYEGIEFPAWEPATASTPQYLDIGGEMEMTSGWLHEDQLMFWSNLYKKYGYLY